MGLLFWKYRDLGWFELSTHSLGHLLVLTVVLFSGLRFLPLHCGREPQRRSQRPWASSALLVVKTPPWVPSGQDLVACPEALSPFVPPPCVRHPPGGPLRRCASVCLDVTLEPLKPVLPGSGISSSGSPCWPSAGRSWPQSTRVPGTEPQGGTGRGASSNSWGCSVVPSLSCCWRLHVVPRTARALCL